LQCEICRRPRSCHIYSKSGTQTAALTGVFKIKYVNEIYSSTLNETLWFLCLCSQTMARFLAKKMVGLIWFLLPLALLKGKCVFTFKMWVCSICCKWYLKVRLWDIYVYVQSSIFWFLEIDFICLILIRYVFTFNGFHFSVYHTVVYFDWNKILLIPDIYIKRIIWPRLRSEPLQYYSVTLIDTDS
jgi:hypothetical protein